MDHDTGTSFGKVIPFPAEARGSVRARRRAGGGNASAEATDSGPSPEEGLRLMCAFVGIKDGKLRAGLIDMIEVASREPAPARGTE
jgi:hypothetical protein